MRAPQEAHQAVLTNTFEARHGVLARGYGSAPDPADPADVLAMQVVLRIEKRDPPARSALLAAAATAAVALCLDERSGPGGEWGPALHAWVNARIRKVTRRARGKQWEDVQELPGVTVASGGAEARALVPGAVGNLDPRVKKLQISGTDLPDDEPGEPAPKLPVIWIDAALAMSTGKAAAQVGHAAMILAGAMTFEQVRNWARHDFACSVRDASPEQWARLQEAVRSGDAVAVRDAGFTEVAPGSTTVIAEPHGLP
ncbi:aminoacyl-tRNA hydrolase [Tomitella fengzijianii]|nr:aminoacyl-tRNA hydrolase [Tomitella fengzijianii]